MQVGTVDEGEVHGVAELSRLVRALKKTLPNTGKVK